MLETLFVFSWLHFARFSAVYGDFGSIVALLMWICLSGSLLIFGVRVCTGWAQITGRSE